jgi:hypothetical protein
MTKLNESQLRSIIRNELFNNQINEIFQTDSVENIAYNKDKPGPNISGDQDYENSFDIESDMPILPSDITSDPTLLKVVHNVTDKNYSPKNKKELRSAALSLIDNYNDLESEDVIKKAWSNFKQVLNKVCEK